MSRNSKSKTKRGLGGLKEETAEEIARDKNDSRGKRSSLPLSVARQSATLDGKVPFSVQQQSSALNATSMPPAVIDQSVPMSVRSQSDSLNYDMPMSVLSQSSALNEKLAAKRAKKGGVPSPPPVISTAPLAPPPPPPVNIDPSKKVYSPIRLSMGDLILGRDQLKAPKPIIKQVDMDRQELFEAFNEYKYMPLVDAREAIRMKALRSELRSITFDGVEQLSDAFLYSLCHCKLDIKTIQSLSFSGCYNITDEGVYWLLQAFGSNLKSIFVDGCGKITEKSLHYMSNCPELKQVVLSGTNVRVIPDYVHQKKHPQTQKDYNVTITGSYIISPLVLSTNKSYPVPYRKVVILTPDKLPWNPLAVLTGQDDIKSKQGFLYKQDWTPFKTHRISNVKSSAEIFNVFQMSENCKELTEMILSPGCIVILPYHLHQDMDKQPALKLAISISKVVTKYDDCTFVLLGMTDQSDNLDYQSTVEQMEKNVLTYISHWTNRLKKSKHTAINTNWRMAALKYWDQELLSTEIHALRTLDYLQLEEQKTITSQFVSVGGSSKLSAKDLKFLQTIVETDEKHFPWNRIPISENKVLEYSNNLKKNPIKLTSLADFHKNCTLPEPKGRPLFVSQVKSFTEYAALWGHALYFPLLDVKGVLTDFNFLSDVITKLMYSTGTKSCYLRCIQHDVPYWSTQDLLNVWKGSTEEQSAMLMSLLEKLGFIIRLPIDPWSVVQENDVSSIYVLYKDLPSKQPSILSEFWPLKTPTNIFEIERYYFACPGLPDSFFPVLLRARCLPLLMEGLAVLVKENGPGNSIARHIFKLGPPTVLWKNGTVIVKGHLTLLVEKFDAPDGLPVILVQVRAPRDLHYNEDWTLLKLYTCIVDYLILKYNIPVARAVPCYACKKSLNSDRYALIKDGQVERFYFEHLIHSVQSKSLSCKLCKTPFSLFLRDRGDVSTQIAPMMAGPDIELWDLVPCHDKNGCALRTSNSLNRCLMCENCASDGMDCNTNLKQGVKNWRCICDKEGKICDYCGLCQRCTNYIMKIIAVVEPQYETTKAARYNQNFLSSTDQVDVVESGSILGLIAHDLEKVLSSSVLKPNYCPDMYISNIKDGSFTVFLKIQTPDERKLEFNSLSGSLLEKDKMLSCGLKTRFVCSDTLHISVQYLKGDYTKMKLTVAVNEGEIYSEDLDAQKITVSVSSQQSDDGVFLQIQTPGKYKCRELKATKGERKTCNTAIIGLPSSLEMVMYSKLEKMEQMCFGGRGLSFSGSSCLFLPSKIVEDDLKYPVQRIQNDMTYHHLCLTFNPVGGKSKIGRFAEAGSSYDAGLESYDTWRLHRLIHLVDGPGIKQTECNSNIGSHDTYLLMVWHFIFSTYPEVILPSTTNKLLPDVSVNEENLIQVKEGLRSLAKVAFWQYLAKFGIDDIEQMFHTKRISANDQVVQYALNIQQVLLENIEMTGLRSVPSIWNANNILYLCPSHSECLRYKAELKTVPPDIFGACAEFITFVDLSSNRLTTIPEEFFIVLKNLTDLKMSGNFIYEIPGTIGLCKKLRSILIIDNNLSDLPAELSTLENLQALEIGNNRFSKVPDVVTKMKNLNKLNIQHMLLAELPEDIGNLVNLKILHASGNCFTSLPESIGKLSELTELQLSGIQWVKLSGNQENVSYQQFYYQILKKRIERWIRAMDKDHNDIFQMFDENSNGVLDIQEVGKMNAAMFNLFPRFGYKGKEAPDESTPDGFPRQILGCKKLSLLQMTYQGFTKVPKEICELKNLVELHVSHNPNLLSIPAEISTLPNMKKLELEDCPLLKTPPREIREKGFSYTYAYLKRLSSGAVLSKKTKLMFVGLGGAGKTSLVKSLMSRTGKAELEQGEGITDGIDIQTWRVTHDNSEITYNIWDFAGQTVYYNTHQFFLSPNRAIYILLWNVRLGYEHAGLDFWLSSIKVQAPDAPVFVIGSHIDQVNKTELPIEEMRVRYPQVVGFHFVSSYTGQGIKELKKKLFDVTLQQQYMGENIPAVWFTFEKIIEQKKKTENVVDYSVIEQLANKSGIFESSEIFQAVQFLHDLGSVQHFSNEYLKAKVVINPQWIVDVMACVVSVKNEVIKDGRLRHTYLDMIWKDYPKKMHTWLLRLTEEFDLTFKLKDEQVNLVPCLLPESKPKFNWPTIEKDSDILETEMEYTFDYLPAGLFNRAQVRLHELSDSAVIWKNGSFLKKNVHIAVLQQIRGNKLLVKAQGPRPENILFLVHEVFEGLIAESFYGVMFDFTMPCPECQKMLVKDPHMFAASTIRRALDMKAPFLQCIKYFHTISCANLQTILPPDSHSDFDAHLVQSIQGLKDLHKDLVADIFISYCDKDDELNGSQYIKPSRVHKDLVNHGYKCWYGAEMKNQSTDEMARALLDSSVFVAFMSTNFAEDTECVNFFKYAKLTLRKPIVVVAIGDGFAWKQSRLGILLADEVFVNMTKTKYEFYDSKYEELISTLKGRTRTVSKDDPKPAVFFSYSWVNSASAVALGTREIPGALGYGDPRLLKTYLEENGISCWIDVERVGMNGLFDDIANGLLSAKVVIVCMSDEYANSPTCQSEFRYAAGYLKLPIILAVVGTGDQWRSKEVGLMSVQYPLVNFQEKTKTGKNKLLTLVNNYITKSLDPDVEKKKKNKANENHKDLSYTELFELAQRKLLRQLILYAENQDLDVYPRLFVVDFINDVNKEQLDNEKESKETEEKVESESNDIKTSDSTDGYQEKPEKAGLRKHASVLSVPSYKLKKFCVYTLCEHYEGWHSVAQPIELPSEFGVVSLDEYSPYLSRVTTVMKYNKKLTLNCFSDEEGKGYVDWLEKSPDATLSDYQNIYHSFRDMMVSLDTDSKMGNLTRCQLTSGKTIWLCDKHKDSMRVTCLSNEEKSINATKDADSKVNNYMITSLREADPGLMKYEDRPNALLTVPDEKSSSKTSTKDIKGKTKTSHHHHHHKHKSKGTTDKTDDTDGGKDVKPENSTTTTTSDHGNLANKDSTDGKTGSMTKVLASASTKSSVSDNKTNTSDARSAEYNRQSSQQSVASATDTESVASERSSRNRRLPPQQKYKNLSRQSSRACEIS